MSSTTTRLNAMVDKLGALQAQIAGLRSIERELKDNLIASGFTEFDGDLFRATVAETSRNTVAWKKIATDLGASAQKIRANTKSTPVTAVKLVALPTVAKAA
jgi:hypothetical protein